MLNPALRVLVLGLLLALSASACKSPQKLAESGDYDQAINLAIDRLAGKKKKDPQHVATLQDAFAKATERDMSRAEQLKQENKPENWERVYDLYDRVLRRQDKIRPLLPLQDKRGVEASFRFVRAESLLNEAREKAAEHLYFKAKDLLAAGQQGNKAAARQAYSEFGRLNYYYQSYRDRNELMALARELGISHIYFEIVNDAPVVMSAALEEALTEIRTAELNQEWQQYHLRPVSEITFDYRILMRLTRLDVTPELVRERQYEDTKEIEDGFDYVLDERGNVRKDSLGNDIKVPRRVVIRANVLEVEQHKKALLDARLEVYDARSKALLDSQPIAADAVFQNFAATFSGDRRALSADTRSRIGNQPVPFPSSEALLLQAADAIKPTLRNRIASSRVLF